jgi:hypothetical protein
MPNDQTTTAPPVNKSRTYGPMSDEAAEAALLFLVETAAAAGRAKGHMIYMERRRQIVLAQLKERSPHKSDTASDTWARAQDEYEQACIEERDANEAHETFYWKRLAAEATIEAWRTKNANVRGAHRMT